MRDLLASKEGGNMKLTILYDDGNVSDVIVKSELIFTNPVSYATAPK